tara:strand:+ start:610 stop:846 length:237 start_codon:yes stop_codon:yes gene_type:complete
MAALGGSFSLTPPVQPDITQDSVDQAARVLINAWRDYAETVREFEIQEGTGTSAAGFYGSNAARDLAADCYSDFVAEI